MDSVNCATQVHGLQLGLPGIGDTVLLVTLTFPACSPWVRLSVVIGSDDPDIISADDAAESNQLSLPF